MIVIGIGKFGKDWDGELSKEGKVWRGIRKV